VRAGERLWGTLLHLDRVAIRLASTYLFGKYGSNRPIGAPRNVGAGKPRLRVSWALFKWSRMATARLWGWANVPGEIIRRISKQIKEAPPVRKGRRRATDQWKPWWILMNTLRRTRRRCNCRLSSRRVDSGYRKASDTARNLKDVLHARESDDREDNMIQSSARSRAAQLAYAEAVEKLQYARDARNVAAVKFGQEFLRELDGTADEVASIEDALSIATKALRDRAFAISNFAAQYGLPCHRVVAHAANLDPLKLKFNG
jgi:hypothetical protein